MRRGLIIKFDCMIAQVDGVTTPVAASRDTLITSFSKAHIACTVFCPNSPSIGPGSNFKSFKRCCKRKTSSPFMPSSRVRSSGTVTSGTELVSTTTSGFELSLARSFEGLDNTPTATTVAKTAKAISANLHRSITDPSFGRESGSRPPNSSGNSSNEFI